MIKHPYTNTICISVIICVLFITVAWMFSPQLGVIAATAQPKYAETLFSTDVVHTIDIQVQESAWQTMLSEAQIEEYILADVVIDGTKVSGVALRPKGNSSLATITKSDSDRYSFKVEFDHYSKELNYNGLDKLVLNNIAQDNTYMKDYITYQMMNTMEVDAPLSSFIWVTINGEDWGLYLAVEAVEESFAQRVYGNQDVEIYKPDSMDMNNGNQIQGNQMPAGEFPVIEGEIGELPVRGNLPQRPNIGGAVGEMPAPGERPNIGQLPNGGQIGVRPDMGGFGGMGGATTLLYTDDNLSSYAAIFDNAAFTPSTSDKKQLISSLKQLNNETNLEEVLDVDEVIRYFVVHNFVLNADSYTGNLIHNYYLAESDGQLAMIPWDYNLAFGGMGGGMGQMPGDPTTTAETETTTNELDQGTTLVNYPIDSPLLSGSMDQKPMLAWIFNNEEYLSHYHEIYTEYVAYFTSGEFAELYDNTISLISPFVEKDPTAFTTLTNFETASATLKEFCLLRAESIGKQLEGVIAITSEEQTATNQANFVDASHIDVTTMGTNNMGFDRARGR